MDSLSDVLKSMRQMPHLQQFEEQLDKLIADPLVRKFRLKHPDLDDQTLKQHLNQLYQYVTEYRRCMKCPGLERCPNDFQGHYTRLTVESLNGKAVIYDAKVSCKKFIQHETQSAVQRRIKSFYVDDRALREGYSPDEILMVDPKRTKSVKRVMEYIVRTQNEGLQASGLYLAGSFGTGKTFLMCYMLHEFAKIGYTGAIVYMPDFVEDLKSMLQKPEQIKETIDLLKDTDVLIFDDIGAENLNPWVRDHVMGAILNYRMNRKPTFYTSNYDLSSLEKHFSFTSKDGEEEYKGQRIMDRIRPFVEVIVVSGTNKRGKK